MSWRWARRRWAGSAVAVAGGRKAADVDPELRPALLALVEPDMRGDTMSALRWTVKSTRQLADELMSETTPMNGELNNL
jgi:hypothetical protein